MNDYQSEGSYPQELTADQIDLLHKRNNERRARWRCDEEGAARTLDWQAQRERYLAGVRDRVPLEQACSSIGWYDWLVISGLSVIAWAILIGLGVLGWAIIWEHLL